MKNQKSKIKNLSTRPSPFNFFVVTIFCLAFLVIPAVSYAQGGTGNPTPSGTVGTTNRGSVFSIQNPLKVDSIGGLVQAFVEVFTYLVVIVAVLALVYVGLRYILARGNPEEMKKMSSWLLYIVIGVAIVIGARILVGVVINTLEATGVVDRGIIQSAQNANNRR